MAESVNAITGVNNARIDASQVSAMNNNQITSMLVGGNIDPKFATMLISQMTTNNVNSILFGNETNNQDSTNAGIDFGVSGLTPTNVPGTTNINDVFGASAFSNVSPQFELSVYSSLIGKTVTATDPSSGKQITDKVKSVVLQNGKVMLDVNGVIVPPENLSKIAK
jgi:hypothetical protein